MQDELIASIAQDLGIGHMSKEQQQALISHFGQVAMKAATIAIVEKLPPEKRKEFANFAESGDSAGLQAFLDKEVPGHEEIAKAAVSEEVAKFKAIQAP